MKIIKKMKQVSIILCLAIVLISLAGCQGKNALEADEGIQDTPVTLKVYVVGDAMNTRNEEGEMYAEYYFTNFVIGDYETSTSRMGYGYEGHMWYQFLQQYQKDTQATLEIEYFPYPEKLEERLLTEKENGPDVILNTFSSYADYYSLIQQGYFADLSEYMETYAMYTSGEYFEPVLRGGQFEGKQYIMPMLFNISTLMSSRENLNQYGLAISKEMNLHELLSQLTSNMNQAQDRMEYETVTEQLAGPAYYIPHVLFGAAGDLGVDYETKTVDVNQELFEDLCIFTKALYQQQFGLEWDSYIQNNDKAWEWYKTLKVQRMCMDLEMKGETIRNESGYVIEGGSSFNACMHSAAAQASYYESRYKDDNKEFILQKIPTWNGEYTANISAFGAVMAGSKEKAASYRLLKYLADQDYFFHLGLSVNREKTAKMLDDLCSTEYEINDVFGHLPQDVYEADYKESVVSYKIKPMSNETRKQLEQMLDDVTECTLPDWSVYGYYKIAIEDYCRENLTLEEAYQQLVSDLEEYMKEGYNGEMVYKVYGSVK